MGIVDFLEEAAGAVVAEQVLEKVDPDAGFLAKAAAAVAGFEGVKVAKEHFEGDDADEAVDTDA